MVNYPIATILDVEVKPRRPMMEMAVRLVTERDIAWLVFLRDNGLIQLTFDPNILSTELQQGVLSETSKKIIQALKMGDHRWCKEVIAVITKEYGPIAGRIIVAFGIYYAASDQWMKHLT